MSQTSLDGEGVEQAAKYLDLDEGISESSEEVSEGLNVSESPETAFEEFKTDLDPEIYDSRDFARFLEGFIGQHQPSIYDSSREEVEEEIEELPGIIRPGLEEAARELLDSGEEDILIRADSYERNRSPRYLRYTEGEVSDQVMDEFWDVLGDPDTYDGLDKDLRIEFAREEGDYSLVIQQHYSK